jgi:hypothetical protein
MAAIARTARTGRGGRVTAVLAEIEKGQQLAGHFPDAEALDRARRVLEGRITPAQADAELAAKYRDG